VPEAVRALTEEGPRYVRELIEWGAAFDRGADGEPALGREAAHSGRRVLHARDTTGREISRVLWQKVAAHPRVTVYDDALAMSLVTRRGECVGATFVGRDGTHAQVDADRTLIATGGAGLVFRETTNPAIATGDGIAIAFDAGAHVADLEFVQFHPTVLSAEGAPRFLLSEALRGEGARLVNGAGEAFMTRYETAGDLASRDLVARAIVKEVARTGGPVYLTMAHLDPVFVRHRFPTIARACREAGFDLATDPVPVSPAAHYVMGGVETDLYGRTSVAGLFAAGEAACTGVHGANRLASNSLLEGLVFGARAAEAMRSSAVSPLLVATLGEPIEDQPAEMVLPEAFAIRDLMWHHAGLVRTAEGLRTAASQLAAWRAAATARRAAAPADRECRRLASLVTVGLLIARAALRREETRGGHFRADFPDRDDIHFRRHFADALRA
jgi:L-aspartate oxidase